MNKITSISVLFQIISSLEEITSDTANQNSDNEIEESLESKICSQIPHRNAGSHSLAELHPNISNQIPSTSATRSPSMLISSLESKPIYPSVFISQRLHSIENMIPVKGDENMKYKQDVENINNINPMIDKKDTTELINDNVNYENGWNPAELIESMSDLDFQSCERELILKIALSRSQTAEFKSRQKMPRHRQNWSSVNYKQD